MYLASFENGLRICSNSDTQIIFSFLSNRAAYVTGSMKLLY